MTLEPCASAPTLTPMSPPRRILSIWLARLSVDRWRRALAPDAPEASAPTALILETAHGPRITAANDAGLAAGARAGMLLEVLMNPYQSADVARLARDMPDLQIVVNHCASPMDRAFAAEFVNA